MAKLVQVSRPAVPAVSVEMAKLNLRIDGDYLDDLVAMWIEGIVAIVEHEVGQKLIRQAWRVVLDHFPRSRTQCADVCTAGIPLPHPVLGVTSVSYADADRVWHQLPDTAYQLVRTEISTSLVPASGAEWPSVWPSFGAVKIDVECGYGDNPSDIPANCRLYILAKLVEQFDPDNRPDKNVAQSAFLERMLGRCRTYQ